MFRRYFVTGLLIWVPLVITLWVLNLIVSTMDQSLTLLPVRWQPRTLLGLNIPGLGMVLTLLVIFGTGLLTRNIIGQQLVRWWESLLGRIPFVRSIYSSVKQVSDTVLADNGQAFRKALLVQYPREGIWTIAFQTGTPSSEVLRKLMPATGVMAAPTDAADAAESGPEMVSLYVPTTPNPTSGFFLIVARRDVIELDMTVDEALKYVVSMGVVSPGSKVVRPPSPSTQPVAADAG